MIPSVDLVLPRLKEAAQQHQLVLLVGAGLSKSPPAFLPGWKDFLDLMADFVAQFQSSRADLIREEAAAGKFLDAAELFVATDRIPAPEKRSFLRGVFDKQATDTPTIYNLVAQVPAIHFLTTNFDPFLRFALNKEMPAVEILTNTLNDIKTVINLWTTKRFAIHLHGRWFDETVIFSRSHYETFQRRHDYRDFLKRIFTEHTVLAFGYSCRDPDVLQTLRFIVDELGGAGERTHYLLTSDEAPSNADLLRQANFLVVTYSADDNHAEARKFFRELKHEQLPLTVAPVLPKSRQRELRSLARIYMSLSDPKKRASTYDTASASIILHTFESVTTQERLEILGKIRTTVHVREDDAKRMLDAGLRHLASTGSIGVDGDHITLKHLPVLAPGNAIADAIERRLATYSSRFRPSPDSRSIIRDAVTYIMVAQGLTMARALINEDDVGAYDLPRLVREALKNVGTRIPGGLENELEKSIQEVLLDPDPSTGSALFELAHAAYSLEALFLNPIDGSLGTVLKWKIFLDSNVILRIISPANKHHASFRNLLERCKRLKTPICVLYPFVEETFTHIRLVGEILADQGVTNLEALIEYVATIPSGERSPILEWYLADVSLGSWSKYSDFMQKRLVNTVSNLIVLLQNIGVETDGIDATKRMDVSVRETLWAELRGWRRDSTSGGRRLRRNEATQVEWLQRLRKSGTKGWFLSIDGQLRRALVELEHGTYAGFVITPTALAHQLADLHWGEVDFGGFASMMWSGPLKTIEERAEEAVLRRLLEQHPEVKDVDPEWLRDRVDDLFVRENFNLAMLAVEFEHDGRRSETAFRDVLNDILPKAVDKILEEVAAKRLEQERSTTGGE